MNDRHEIERLRRRTAPHCCVTIGVAPLREPVRLCGEIQGIRLAPLGNSEAFEVTITDGTAKAVGVFTQGRIPGLDPGRLVVLEGVAQAGPRGPRLLNPEYTLLP